MARFLSGDIPSALILNGIPPNAAAENRQGNVPVGKGIGGRQNFIQCRQCSEQFPKSTVICRRCNRVNERSAFIVSLKIFAVVLFVITVAWVVQVAGSYGGPSVVDHISLPVSSAPASMGQADLGLSHE